MKAAKPRKVPMPATALALFLAAVSASAGERPLLAAGGDGSWLVLEAIAEEAPPLDAVTGGLLIDEEKWAEASDAAREVAIFDLEEAARRAFEEAVDAARREPRD